MTETGASVELYSLLAEHQQALQQTDILLQPQNGGQVDPGDARLCDSLDDYRRFLLRNAQVLALTPLQFRQSAANWYRGTSIVRDADCLIHSGQLPESRWLQQQFVPDEDPTENLLWQYQCDDYCLPVWSAGGLLAVAAGTEILLFSADSQLLHTMHGDESLVCSVNFSPCGKLIASSGLDRTVRVWSAEDGRMLHAMDGHGALQFHSGSVNHVSFSPCGKRVASAGEDCTVRIWSVEDGDMLRTIEMANDPTGRDRVYCATFSPCGKRIASIVDDGTIRIWSVESGRLLCSMYHYNGQSVSFSPCGQRVLSAGRYGIVRVWSTEEGHELRTTDIEGDWFDEISFSSCAQRFASPEKNGRIRVWSVDDGCLLLTLQHGHYGRASHVSFSPCGQRIASTGEDRTVRVWLVEEGSTPDSVDRHDRGVEVVRFISHGKHVASAGGDGKVRVWLADNGRTLSTTSVQSRDWVDQTYISHGEWRASSGIGSVLISKPNSKFIHLRGHEGFVNSISFSSCGKLIASASQDRTLRVWSTENGAQLAVAYFESRVWSVDTHTDEKGRLRIVAGLEDGRIMWFRLEERGCQRHRIPQMSLLSVCWWNVARTVGRLISTARLRLGLVSREALNAVSRN